MINFIRLMENRHWKQNCRMYLAKKKKAKEDKYDLLVLEICLVEMTILLGYLIGEPLTMFVLLYRELVPGNS